MGKGEIARYKQFLLFPQCFQKACYPGASKGVIVWEWVNSLPNDRILGMSKGFADNKINDAEMMIFVCDNWENIVGKEENTGHQHFLLFLQCFLSLSCTGS